MLVMAEKKPRARSRAAPKTPLSKVIARHNEITLLIALYEAVLETCEENFVYRDGLEPKSLIVTNDGRRVPEDMISDALSTIRSTLLTPLEKELNQLNKKKV